MNRISIRLADSRADPPAEIDTQVDSGLTIGEFIGGMSPLAQEVPFGVWGKRVTPDYVLREGDRVEIYRPLLADPKEARRRRARATGS
jgi:hypothetical protein